MPRLTFLVVPVLVAAIGIAAGCGGGGDDQAATTQSSQTVPADAVAVVAGTPVTKAEFDRFFAQREKASEAQGQEFPAAGTPEYVQLQNQAVDFLVQRIELAKEAESLGIAVTDKEVSARVDELKNQFFEGDDAKYQEELKSLGLTDADVRADVRAQLIAEKIFDQVTKDVTVTADDVKSYYDNNTEQFEVPESREVAHILVDTKKEAQDLYAQLQDGADFAALAKEHSTDTGSAENGGKLTDERGSFVPEFEEVAFALETGEIGEPVKSQFGWHIIKALQDTQPAETTSFDDAKASIEEQLLEERRNEAMTTWVNQVRTKFASQVAYAVGFAAPPAADATATTP
jgi:parvulin-like peptidyl-prolyl isomerase